MANTFVPIVIPIISDPEPPPYQVTIKIKKGDWERGQEQQKILNILSEAYGNKIVFDKGDFLEKRRFAGLAGFLFSILSIIITIILSLSGFISFMDNSWFPQPDFTKIFLALLIIIFIGVIFSYVWAHFFKYSEIDWIEYHESRDSIVLGIEDESKSSLMNLINMLKEEGIE